MSCGEECPYEGAYKALAKRLDRVYAMMKELAPGYTPAAPDGDLHGVQPGVSQRGQPDEHTGPGDGAAATGSRGCMINPSKAR